MVVVVIGSEAALLLQLEQGNFPIITKEPEAIFVFTLTQYLVLLFTEQAVTVVQSQFKRGYVAVPPPIVIKTGAFIVAELGIFCAITIQYFSLLL